MKLFTLMLLCYEYMPRKDRIQLRDGKGDVDDHSPARLAYCISSSAPGGGAITS